MSKYLRFAATCHVLSVGCVAALVGAAWLPTNAVAANASRPAGAIEVFHCTFDQAWDVNYDQWPDRWIRNAGLEYPHYVDIQIRETDDNESANGRYLAIDLDGASAAVASPPIRVMSRFSYYLEARLKVRGLRHSEVSVTIDFLDSSGNVLQTERRRIKAPANGWQTVRLDTIDPADDSIDRAVIGLEVQRTGRGDLKGKVYLDELWLARLPRITVSTNSSHNVYERKQDVLVRCDLSGIRERSPTIHFQLLDVVGQELQRATIELDGRLIVDDTKLAAEIFDGSDMPAGYEGAHEWRPDIPGHGFYSVVVTMGPDAQAAPTDHLGATDRRVVWFTVLPPLPIPAKGDFGWSLPQGDKPLAFSELSGLLPLTGAGWAKVPAWYDVEHPKRGDDIIRFVELLGASNIEVVGVIDRPPAGTDMAQRMGAGEAIADLLVADPSLWMPSLDPVMSRLSMRLRCWQLGGDQDTSFVGFPNLGMRVSELRGRLFRFGQEVKLGLAWPTDAASPSPRDATWDFEQITPEANLGVQEFEHAVSQPRRNSRARWIAVAPPLASDNTAPMSADELDRRAIQFVRKMIAAKQHGADGVFMSQPFHEHCGLMRPDGMPTPMLLPWRTTAAMLSGAKYLGSIQLPRGSENRIFQRRDGVVVMAVWNSELTQERLYLGSDVRQFDLWGHETRPALEEQEHVLQVGPMPLFVFGLNAPVTHWRMAVRFEQDYVESVFGRPHPNAIHFKNAFPRGVGGTVSIVAPLGSEDRDAGDDSLAGAVSLESDRWSIDPPQQTFSLGAAETSRFPFEVRLKNAIFGQQPMRVDFVVDAGEEEPFRFSVYRTMWVGTGEVSIDIKTHLDTDGTLVVEQIMANSGEQPVDFKCYLHAKGHRRQRAQVYRLGSTPDRTVYRFPDGDALVGKEMLLEAEEIGGERVLKYRFVATKDRPPESQPSPDSASNNEAMADALR